MRTMSAKSAIMGTRGAIGSTIGKDAISAAAMLGTRRVMGNWAGKDDGRALSA